MIKIIAIGKIKEKSMTQLIDEYAKRMNPISKVQMIELPNSNKPDNEISVIIDDESQRILSKIDANDFVILLDLKGKDFSSREMSSKMIDALDKGKNVTFVIGGSHGVSDGMRLRADFLWRISNLTFPHQLVRVMLYEQIYRMFMISRNHPYHK